MKVFLDDQRPAPEGWTLVKTAKEAIALLEAGQVEEISLDHDLGDVEEDTGYDVLVWIEEGVEWRDFVPPSMKVHSANPPAAERMEQAIRAIERRAAHTREFPTREDWKRFLKESEKKSQEDWQKEIAEIPEEKRFEHALGSGDKEVHRPAVQYLLRRLKDALPDLEHVLESVDDHWASEDGVYRFYHQSYKVFYLNNSTSKIMNALRAILPHQPLNKWLQTIVADAMSRDWDRERSGYINDSWLNYTRPVVEAFFHARYFLGMCVKYAKELPHAPRTMPSGWAAVLYLYDLR